jgi:hypothetical protein
VSGIERSHHELGGDKVYRSGRGRSHRFIHGAICDYRVWESQREAVATFAQYVAANLHYHGTEPWPEIEPAVHNRELIVVNHTIVGETRQERFYVLARGHLRE